MGIFTARLVLILADIVLIAAVVGGVILLARRPRLSRERTYIPVVSCVTVITGLVALFGSAALLMRGRGTAAFAIWFVCCAGALMAVLLVAVIASSALNVAAKAKRSRWARIVLGLDAAVVGSSLFGGALTFFLLNRAAGMSWYLAAAYLCVCALGVAGARLAVIGVFVSVGRVKAVRLFATLRALKSWVIGPRLTFGGWVVLLLSMVLVLIVGVQVAMLLYQGARPQGWPNVLLALPIVVVGAFSLMALVSGAQTVGIRLTSDHGRRSGMSASSSGNAMLDLRRQLLEGDTAMQELPDSIDKLKEALGDCEDSRRQFSIWRRLRELGAVPTGSEAKDVFGVIGEIGTPDGSAMVFGLSDGSASLYTSSGGGIIGGASHEPVRKASKRLVEQAGAYTKELPVVTDFSFPPRGVQAAEASEESLTSGQHHLAPIFVAWNNLLTQLRLTDPVEYKQAAWQSAAAYTNCLLTLMREKALEPITLVDGEPLPDMSKVATTQEDHEFIEDIELPLEQIAASDVISILLRLALFRWYRPFKQVGTLRVKLTQRGGQLVDVSFQVRKSREDQRCRVVLSLL
jgi:hypothetical protein